MAGCKSNPNKVENLDTQMSHAAKVSGNEKIGVKNDEMVVISKEDLAEKLRDLQNDVYSLEDQVYGTRKLGSLGLYGELKACKRKLASKQFGGTGTLIWTEPLDRITDKEEQFKAGLDEHKALVGVSQEYLNDRIKRFEGYKLILQKRSDEFRSNIEACKGELADRKIDQAKSSRVLVSEVPKSTVDKDGINHFMCGYVKAGASLETFMVNAFAKGWLSLSDFSMDQNLIGSSLKDAKGTAKQNGMIFGGWKLVFDQKLVTVGQLLDSGSDAHLVAWSYDHKDDLKDAGCLNEPDGVWNP
jgi:hypothetical protein